MNYHTEIEKLRLQLLHATDLTPKQRAEGYVQLREMVEDYLASEGVAI